MSDLINRQAAINKINERQRELIYCFGLDNDMVKIMDIAKSIVTAMPSAQSMDVIDIDEVDKEAIKALYEEFKKSPIMILPSAQPERKKGEWIEFDSGEDKYDVIKCSCCKHTFTVDSYHWTDIGFIKDDFNFCPECGADMRGEEECTKKI